MAIPMYYGGIDRTYGDLSIETADKVLDILDNYIELVESVEDMEKDKGGKDKE